MIYYLNSLWIGIAVLELFMMKAQFNPARILGLTLFSLSKVLVPLWEFSKFSQGSGITTFLEFPRSEDFEASLIISAIAMQLSSLLFHIYGPKVKPSLRVALASIRVRSDFLSLLLLIFWGIGQGTSLFLRNSYLQSNGELAFLRPLAFLAPLIAVFLYALVTFSGRSTRFSLILALAWMAFLLGIGSRSSLLFISVLIVSLFARIYKSELPAFRIFLIFWVGYFGTFLLLSAFSATLYARFNAHGLFRLGDMFIHEGSPSLIADGSWLDAISSFLISIASSYPIISLSIYSVVPQSVLLINANPLPTEILGISPNNSSEFILPWLPKAVVGELYGSFGPLGLFIWMLVMGIIAMFFYANYLKNGRDLAALAVGALFIASVLLALQYPSRVVFRVYSLVYLIPLVGYASRKLFQQRTSARNASPDRQPSSVQYGP